MQKQLNLEPFVTAQMYYSLVGRELEYDFTSCAEYHKLGVLVWSALAGGYLTGKYAKPGAAEQGTRFAEAGQFVPFDWDKGEPILNALRVVAERHEVSLARVAYAWTLSRPAVSSVIIAARKISNLDDNIAAVDLKLTSDDLELLNTVSDPGTPYPKWMVLATRSSRRPAPENPRAGKVQGRRAVERPAAEVSFTASAANPAARASLLRTSAAPGVCGHSRSSTRQAPRFWAFTPSLTVPSCATVRL